MHWALQYIGREWRIGKNGDMYYDCYGLVQRVLSRHFSTEISRRLLIARLSNFEELNTRVNGAITLLTFGAKRMHVGIWLQDRYLDGLLHATTTDGVVFSKLNNMRDWHIQGFYKYKNKNNG